MDPVLLGFLITLEAFCPTAWFRFDVFPSSIISSFMLALVHTHFLCPLRLLPTHPSVLSLIETDEKGYEGVWLESSADRLNQGGSFTQHMPIHPRTHTLSHERSHTPDSVLHNHTALRWLPAFSVYYFTPGKSGGFEVFNTPAAPRSFPSGIYCAHKTNAHKDAPTSTQKGNIRWRQTHILFPKL